MRGFNTSPKHKSERTPDTTAPSSASSTGATSSTPNNTISPNYQLPASEAPSKQSVSGGRANASIDNESARKDTKIGVAMRQQGDEEGGKKATKKDASARKEEVQGGDDDSGKRDEVVGKDGMVEGSNGGWPGHKQAGKKRTASQRMSDGSSDPDDQASGSGGESSLFFSSASAAEAYFTYERPRAALKSVKNDDVQTMESPREKEKAVRRILAAFEGEGKMTSESVHKDFGPAKVDQTWSDWQKRGRKDTNKYIADVEGKKYRERMVWCIVEEVITIHKHGYHVRPEDESRVSQDVTCSERLNEIVAAVRDITRIRAGIVDTIKPLSVQFFAACTAAERERKLFNLWNNHTRPSSKEMKKQRLSLAESNTTQPSSPEAAVMAPSPAAQPATTSPSTASGASKSSLAAMSNRARAALATPKTAAPKAARAPVAQRTPSAGAAGNRQGVAETGASQQRSSRPTLPGMQEPWQAFYPGQPLRHTNPSMDITNSSAGHGTTLSSQGGAAATRDIPRGRGSRADPIAVDESDEDLGTVKAEDGVGNDGSRGATGGSGGGDGADEPGAVRNAMSAGHEGLQGDLAASDGEENEVNTIKEGASDETGRDDDLAASDESGSRPMAVKKEDVSEDDQTASDDGEGELPAVNKVEGDGGAEWLG